MPGTLPHTGDSAKSEWLLSLIGEEIIDTQEQDNFRLWWYCGGNKISGVVERWVEYFFDSTIWEGKM